MPSLSRTGTPCPRPLRTPRLFPPLFALALVLFPCPGLAIFPPAAPPQGPSPTALFAPAGPARGARGVEGLDFEALARRWVAEHVPGDALPASPEELLDRFCVRLDLGALRLFAPRDALSRPQQMKRFQGVAQALLDAQSDLARTLDPGGDRARALSKEFEPLAKEIGRWRAGAATDLAAKEGSDLLVAFGAKDAVREASARATLLATRLVAPARAGEEGASASPFPIALAPTRETFVGLLAAAGLVDERARSALWVPGAERWLRFRAGDVEVVSGAFTVPGEAPDAWGEGIPIDAENPNALPEQIAQLALTRLLAEGLAGTLPAPIASGLAMNLVIDRYGELDTRIDGDLSERFTGAREIFVRGGLSQGGRLPKNDADSPWRAGLGKDRYRRVLRQAQKAAAGVREGSANKLARFLLRSRDQSETFVVSAPILGEGGTREVPEAFAGEYAEFLRAWRCAFVAWLREKGAGSRDRSAEAFARLLAELSRPDVEGGFAGACERVYGRPLADEECSSRSLEGRFVSWIARG